MSSDNLSDYLALINDILQAIIVIFGSAVVLYNRQDIKRDRVIRAFSALITFVIIVYLTELLVSRTIIKEFAEQWLKVGWIGIVLVPAALFHLSDALLIAMGDNSSRRRWAVYLWYGISLFFLLLVSTTDLIVADLIPLARAPHLKPGPLFPLFTIYFWPVVTATSIFNVLRARQRCLTTTSKQRMNIILGAFIAAPLAVFPYFLLSRNWSDNPDLTIPTFFWIILILGNLFVAVLFALLTNTLSYFGAISLDRVVRVRLYKYMARVPLTASIVLLVFVVVNRFSTILGLPTDTALGLTLVGTVIIVEWAIHAYKRPLERFLQLDDDPDVQRIQKLSERLFTTRDLHQFLETVLASACNALHSPAAFIASITPEGADLEAVIGPLELTSLQDHKDLQQITNPHNDAFPVVAQFILWNNFWIRPLYNQTNDTMLGILGIQARSESPDLTDLEYTIFNELLRKAAVALEDRLLQEEVFAAVEGLLPQITALQEWRQSVAYAPPTIPDELIQTKSNTELLSDPDFTNWVKDALTHYWGGPKLTGSPLQELYAVQTTADSLDGNRVNALRTLLAQAIELQKPEGEKRLSPEWILYNILELKFLQGNRVRDIARRLAMSESDLYRKQRIAIENVARTLLDLEKQNLIDPESPIES